MRILHLFTTLIILYILTGCSTSKQIAKQANSILFKDTAISTGHIGICIYEPATNKYWYTYNDTHYFIPASNTKLFTLYAGMKYLGDSLVGLRYLQSNDTILFQPTADPTFLFPEFSSQPVFDFLKKKKVIVAERYFGSWQTNPLGFGWAWDDYNSDYMAERSDFPIYGNLLKIKSKSISTFFDFQITKSAEISPPYFYKADLFEKIDYSELLHDITQEIFFRAKRILGTNKFHLTATDLKPIVQSIPFSTESKYFLNDLLGDTLKNRVYSNYSELIGCIGDCNTPAAFVSSEKKYPNAIHSQPTDSLFKPMMHRSDNFFAEQTLLMASNEHLGYMNDEKIIDTILNTDLKDVPQRPKWVDGSGLSRYNLFTPKSFVYILNKMKNEFGLTRMKNILATGGEGTLAAYFKKDAGFIYAKTGTLSNNCALSGYLITNKGKLLIFSVLANNYITGASPIRRATERFLQGIREKY